MNSGQLMVLDFLFRQREPQHVDIIASYGFGGGISKTMQDIHKCVLMYWIRRVGTDGLHVELTPKGYNVLMKNRQKDVHLYDQE